MHRYGAWGRFLALLVLALTVQTGRADEPARDGDEKPWYKRLFASDDNTLPDRRKAQILADTAPPPAKATPNAGEKPQPLPAAPVSAKTQQQAMADYLRILAACDKLRQIAVDRQDEELMRKADLIEGQAEARFRKIAASLPRPAVAEKSSDTRPASRVATRPQTSAEGNQ